MSKILQQEYRDGSFIVDQWEYKRPHAQLETRELLTGYEKVIFPHNDFVSHLCGSGEAYPVQHYHME